MPNEQIKLQITLPSKKTESLMNNVAEIYGLKTTEWARMVLLKELQKEITKLQRDKR